MHVKGEKSGTLHREISVPFTIQECDNVTAPYYPISAVSSVTRSCNREVKNNRKIQTLTCSSKNGSGCL